MEHGDDSTKSHNHSSSSHDHVNVQDSTSTQETRMVQPQHDHPASAQKPGSNQDSTKRNDISSKKDKKKKLKDMKY